MSFSSPSGSNGGGRGAPEEGATPSKSNFGQAFEQILSQKYPLAGGLTHMVFGGGQVSGSPSPAMTSPGYGGMASAPLPQMPTGETQQPDLLAANAKPPENSGIKNMIMQLLMA